MYNLIIVIVINVTVGGNYRIINFSFCYTGYFVVISIFDICE